VCTLLCSGDYFMLHRMRLLTLSNLNRMLMSFPSRGLFEHYALLRLVLRVFSSDGEPVCWCLQWALQSMDSPVEHNGRTIVDYDGPCDFEKPLGTFLLLSFNRILCACVRPVVSVGQLLASWEDGAVWLSSWLSVSYNFREWNKEVSELARQLNAVYAHRHVPERDVSFRLDILREIWIAPKTQELAPGIFGWGFTELRNYQHSSGSDVLYSLKERTGLPICQCCIFAAVGRRVGLCVLPLNTVGVFTVRVNLTDQELSLDHLLVDSATLDVNFCVVDVYVNCQRVNRDTLGDVNAQMFPPSNVQDVIGRMFNNVLNQCTSMHYGRWVLGACRRQLQELFMRGASEFIV
jgi:hypothetical protein